MTTRPTSQTASFAGGSRGRARATFPAFLAFPLAPGRHTPRRLGRAAAGTLRAQAILLLSALALASPPVARAAERAGADVRSSRDGPRPTALWLATQAVPSPEWILGGSGSRFALRWQITPLLYTFALRRELSPWRFFVVEPLARQGGSLELYFSPAYVMSGERFQRLMPRLGARAYFPIVERGELVSMSFGTSYFSYRTNPGVAFEAGFYVLAGVLGGQFAWSPSNTGADWIVTLRLKYF